MMSDSIQLKNRFIVVGNPDHVTNIGRNLGEPLIFEEDLAL